MPDPAKLTAWERWELASFDAPPPPPEPPPAEAPATPAVHLPTAEELEQIHQQAHDEGYRKGQEEGYRAGFEAGFDAGRQQAQAEAERFASLAGKLEQALAGLEISLADDVLALAVELARQVVRQEITARPQTLLAVVREALAQLPHQHVAIYLHPEDASLLRSYLGEALSHAGHRIHEDMKLERGDCVLEAGGTQIDATVAMRWQRVLEHLGLASAWQPEAAVPPAPTLTKTARDGA
ncbi:MAG: flagellar assembly protein FliH [Rhodocyclaceae bacterium]|nr:flagellar assembly protein FliH [Rhodocyclaceae bacterium]